MNDVIIPTGMIIGDIAILASVSEIRSKRAPNRAEMGIRNL